MWTLIEWNIIHVNKNGFMKFSDEWMKRNILESGNLDPEGQTLYGLPHI